MSTAAGAGGLVPLAGLPTSLPLTARLRRSLSGYARMLRFDLANSRRWLPFTVIMQVLMGAGMAMIYGFYMPGRGTQSTLFIVTGAPALALIPVGLAMLPLIILERRASGTFDFVWSLPVSRAAAVASTLTVFSLIALPGVAVTLALAWWRYGVPLEVTPAIVPAVLLTTLMTCSVGMGLAHGIARESVVSLITNMIVFLVLLFTPIVLPAANFPAWLLDLHQGLPFMHMATVIRAGLMPGVSGVGTAYAVLAAWTVGGWAVTAWVVGRRH